MTSDRTEPPPAAALPLLLEVPEGTVALVTFRHGPDGVLVGHFSEVRDRVPATRHQIIQVLGGLITALHNQSSKLEAEAKSASGDI